jgi:serine/threonine-protein kinase HipA
VASECSWLADARPPEAVRFWAAAYPTMGGVAENVAAAVAAGYEALDTWVLPAPAWWDDYYTPLLDRIARLRSAAGEDLRAAIAAAEAEIDLYRRHGDTFGYVFYLLRRAAG